MNTFDQEKDLNDEEIALLVQKGNIAIYEVLISRYSEKIDRYLRKFLSSPEDIEDILQDIFIKCFVNIRSFDTDQRFSPWIYRIAHNEAINLLKKNSSRPFSFDIFSETLTFVHPKAKEDSENEAERELIKNYLDQILNDLDKKYKEIIVLYFYEDMSYKDISDVLKIPISLVGVRIQRGKEQIKKILKERGLEELKS
ncbi:MAG: RNA polymerase sigma factor [Candidatus Nomurabacteria bacterium]